MKKLALTLALLTATAAQALDLKPDTLGLHTVSHHFHEFNVPGNGGWNNNNFGLYARWGGFTAGAYRNSLYRDSYYVGWTWESDRIGPVYLALTAGAVTGYDKMVADSRNGPLPAGTRTEVRCDGAGCRPVALKDVIAPMLVPSVRLPITERVSARVGLLLTPPKTSTLHLMLEAKF